MAKRRLTKEELEQDPLIDTFEKVESFYESNKQSIIISAVALLLIIGGGLGYYYYSQSQERQAQQLMGYAENYFLQGDYQNALTGSEEDFTVGFEQIINNYSGTDAANLARYYAAVCEYNLGNTEAALQYMQSYEVPEGIMGVGPLSFHGVLLTELGRHEEAAEMYVTAAEWDQNDSTTPYNYLEAANAWHDASNIEMARQYAEIIVNEYPDSPQEPQAERLLGLIAAVQ
ncbi:MAG: tetratricopeptide repeat protein [Balneolaceae bacterium]|nr:tetratricopeptide repeat protein [Balneolaceae bacterium]